jgi:deoxyribose-phosphate aldolase
MTAELPTDTPMLADGARADTGVSGGDRAALAHRLLGLTDLTMLGDDTSAADISTLCGLAANRHRAPAALCVGLPHVAMARGRLDQLRLSRVAVATVVNFPDGSEDLVRIEHETRQALAAGADEVDAVLPYRALRRGDANACRAMLRVCRDACGRQALLKVIIETGELESPELIAQASALAIEGGADFIKTSTGTTAAGATLSAARIMLRAIHAHGGHCGFKASGGIRSLEQALPYLQLAEEMLGRDWIGPARFRIGASTLVHELLAALD